MKILKLIASKIKQNINPEIDTLLFTEKHIIASNGYSLIRIPNTTKARGLYPTQNFSQELVSLDDKFITKDKIIFEPTKLDEESYPDYEKVIPTENKDLFTVDIKRLKDILEIAKEHKLSKISFYNNDRNLYASAENNNGLEVILMKII